MFKWVFKKISDRTINKEIDAYISKMQVGTDSEMGMMLTAVTLARNLLLTSEHVSKPFPENYFAGVSPIIGEEAVVELSMYNLELLSLRKQLVLSSDDRHQVMAAGLDILIHSLRSLYNTDLFPKGRLLWSELLRGTDYYAECMRFRRPDLSDDDLLALWPAPNMLAPSEKLPAI